MKNSTLYRCMFAVLLLTGCGKDKEGNLTIPGTDHDKLTEEATMKADDIATEAELEDVSERKTEIHEDASYANDKFAMAYAMYEDYCSENEIGSLTLIRLDADDCYDLLYMKDSVYHVISFKEDGLEKVELTPNGDSIYAFGQYEGFFSEREWCNTFYEFEYVEGKNLIRYHEETSECTRIDHYINLSTLEEELRTEIKYVDCMDDEGEAVGSQMYMVMSKEGTEIDYDAFYDELGSHSYHDLEPAIVTFSSVSDAYLHRIGLEEGVDETAIYEAFINHEIKARGNVEKASDCYDEIFNYIGFYIPDNEEDEEALWYDYDYDFNEDGINDLYVSGFGFQELYTVMDGELVLACDGSGTAAVLNFYTHNGDYYATTTDTTHGGRQEWRFRRFDGCFRAIDLFDLDAYYWEYIYFSEDADCFYRGNKVTVDEFKTLIADWTDYEE